MSSLNGSRIKYTKIDNTLVSNDLLTFGCRYQVIIYRGQLRAEIRSLDLNGNLLSTHVIKASGLEKIKRKVRVKLITDFKVIFDD